MTTIRKASINDIDQLSELFNLYRIFYKKGTDIDAGKEFLKERFKNNESEIFVAISDSKIVGFSQLYPLFSSTRMKRLWLLNDLFVHPDFRGKGFSIQLIEAAKQLCIDTNACQLTLETSKLNTIGNNLYPKAGFEIDSENNYYAWLNLASS
jgi:ribosomal protein S18 acetylase RimI-like enzyme